MLALNCCLGFSLVVARRGYSLAAIHEYIAVASLAFGGAQAPRLLGFSSCSRWTQQLWFPGSEAEVQ